MHIKSKFYIYLIYSEKLDLYKIGVSKDSYKRKHQLQTGTPYILAVIFEYESKYSFKIETALHNFYSVYKHDSDKIELEGEWFALPEEKIKEFKTTCERIEKD